MSATKHFEKLQSNILPNHALKATIGYKGVTKYYLPDDWTDVLAVYLVPSMSNRKASRLRKKREFFLMKYKTEFMVLPPDPEDIDPMAKNKRRLILAKAPDESVHLVASVILKPKITVTVV